MLLMRKRNAFTLAEVLVTLAVIGVVASLTIPAMVKNISNAGTVAKVKKANSILSQAMKNYMVDNDCVGNLAACELWAGNNNESYSWTRLTPYLSLAKNCGAKHGGGDGCWGFNTTYKYLKGDDWKIMDNSTQGMGILIDGSLIQTTNRPGLCDEDGSRSNSGELYKTCRRIYIDINGHNGPNQMGRDTFVFIVTNSGTVYPAGTPDDYYYANNDGSPRCDPNYSGSPLGSTDGGGFGCAAKIIQENAMDY